MASKNKGLGKPTKAALVKEIVYNASKTIAKYRKHLTERNAAIAHNAVNALSSMTLSKADTGRLHRLETALTVADSAKKASDYLKGHKLTDLINTTREDDTTTRYTTKRKALTTYKKHYTGLMVSTYGKGWKALKPDDAIGTDAGKTFGQIFDEMMILVKDNTQLGVSDSANKTLFKLRFFDAKYQDKARFSALMQILAIDTDERYPDSPVRS